MAVNEGLKPVDPNSNTPVDPNVHIPDHVRRAAEASEAIHKQAYPDEQPAPQPQEQPAPQPQEQPAPQPQEQPAPQPQPGDENITAEEWRHRFLSMQGRYNKAAQTIGAMEQQMGELGQELQRTQQMIQTPPVQHHTPQPDHNNLITPADREAYGDELIDLARRVATSAIGPEIENLRSQNETLTKQVKTTAKRDLFGRLDTALPQWRQINATTQFKSWLRLPNVYTGQIRGEMLKAAVDGAEAPKVLQFFRDFLTEATATGQIAPPAQQQEQAPSPPRQPAVQLETLAAPGRARPASGDSQVPSEKPVYSRADISKFYADSRKGLYAGRQAEYDATQADLTRAQAEGRIRG